MPKALLILLAACIALASCRLLDPALPGMLVQETVETDVSLPAIEANGTRLHGEAFGAPGSPLLVFLHGGPGGSYRDLLPYRALAAQGYRVVFYDQRGSGLSRRHDPRELSIELYLGDLEAVIDLYSEGDPSLPVVLIGHSFGAMLAACFMNERGDLGGRIRGAVLSEPAGFTSDQVQDYLDRLIAGIGFFSEAASDGLWKDQFFTPRSQAEYDYEIASMEAKAEEELEHSQAPQPRWRSGAVVKIYFLNDVLRRGFDWSGSLGAFAHPVLFLRGSLNELMPLSQQERLASYFPDAAVLTIEGTGHNALQERFAESSQAILDFLHDRIGV